MTITTAEAAEASAQAVQSAPAVNLSARTAAKVFAVVVALITARITTTVDHAGISARRTRLANPANAS